MITEAKTESAETHPINYEERRLKQDSRVPIGVFTDETGFEAAVISKRGGMLVLDRLVEQGVIKTAKCLKDLANRINESFHLPPACAPGQTELVLAGEAGSFTTEWVM